MTRLYVVTSIGRQESCRNASSDASGSLHFSCGDSLPLVPSAAFSLFAFAPPAARRFSMLLDFEITHCSRQCAATGRTFAPGETYFSTLHMEAGSPVRRDFA